MRKILSKWCLAKIISSGLFSFIVVTVGCESSAYSACTYSGDASVSNSHCGTDYIQYYTGAGTATLTIADETSTFAELKPFNGATGSFNQTLILEGSTTLSRPDYSAVVMQTESANRDATVLIGENVNITSVGNFGAVWVRNDTSGDIVIENAGTVHATGAPGITGTTNLGSVSVTNTGSVTSVTDWGLYADGGHNNTIDSPALVSIVNSGTVNSYFAGARAINYHGLATITNSGTVNSTTRQGLVAWSDNGPVAIENSGSVTSGDDNAIHAMSETGDVTVFNSGSLTASDDPDVVAVRTGYSGIRAEAEFSGSIAVTNTASGVISAVNDYAIATNTSLGDITILNNGSISGLSGVSATSANGSASLTNNGSINATGQGVFLDGTTNVLINSNVIATSGTLAVGTGDGATTVTNSGTISAGSATDTAISMGNGNNRLILDDSSVIIGKVTTGNGANTLELSGANSGTLNADLIGDSGQYQGFDSVEKTGSGTWRITGASSDVDWTVLSGILSVAGTVQNVVVDGGTLSGSGTVGSLSIGSGATLAPGNSIGTLTAGNVTLASGSTYEVEVDAAGHSDKLASTGTVTIDNGATVSIRPENGTDDGSAYDPYSMYTIISAEGGVVGTFGAVTDTFAFLDAELSYDANAVYLGLLRNDVDFVSIAQTQNQRAVAGVVEAQGTAGALYKAVLPLSADGARNAFDQLSGDMYASTQSMLLDDSRFVREAVLSHLHVVPTIKTSNQDAAAGQNGKFAVWGAPFGAWGDWDGDGNAASLDRSIGGVVAGCDVMLGSSWTTGFAFGYSKTDFDVDSRQSSGSADSYHLGAYALKQLGGLDLTAGGAYSRHQIEADRTVRFGSFHDELNADYDADASQVFGEASYNFTSQTGRISPFLNLAYVHLSTDSFTEQGGEAALQVDSSSQDMVYSTLGLRAEKQVAVGGVLLKPNGSLGWRHGYGDNVPTGDVAFASGNAFAVEGVSIARNAIVGEFGLAHDLTENASINVAYNGQFSSDLNDQGVKATFVVKF